MQINFNTKNKTLFLVAAVLIFSAIMLLGIIYINQKEKLDTIEQQYYSKTNKSYSKILNKQTLFYQSRLTANINSKGVIDALASKDREALYNLSLGRWSTLTKENQYLKVMHFHLADGRSFLRMHEKEKYGDNVALIRPMVASIHKEHKPIYGFEAGIHNFAYRTFAPIFKDKEYIGALEFGTRPDQILDDMLYFNELHGALFVKNESNNLYKEKNNITFNGYSLQYRTAPIKIIESLKNQNYNFQTFCDITVDDKIYRAYSFPLKDFLGNETAKVIFFHDITNIKRDLKQTLEELALLLCGLVIFILIVINIGFKKILVMLDIKNDELSTIFNTSKDGIAILDLETNFLFFNKTYLDMTGFTKKELLTKSCAGLSAPEDVARAYNAISVVLEKGYIENFEKTCIVKDGKRVVINMSIALMPDKERFLISTKDITKAKQQEHKIKNYVELVDKNIITSSTDLDGNITYVSKAFCNISGYLESELLGKNHRIIKHPDMDENIYKEMWDILSRNETWSGEIKNLTKDKNLYWVNASISPIFNELNEKIGYTAIRQNITDKKMIEQISITDGLTNIFNRRHFNDMLPKFISSGKRNNEILCFMIMDIDNFKLYNDTYGHQEGDEVIKSVALVLKNSLHRADDICFRLGGEEFGVLCKVSSKEKMEDFANSIRGSVEHLQIAHELNLPSKSVTISIGLVVLNACDILSADNIYKQADDLLYCAKRSGRNRVVMNDYCELNVKG